MPDLVVVNGILDALGRLPGMLVYGYYWTKALDLRNVRLHWVIWLLFWVVMSIRMPVTGGGGSLESVLWTTSYLFLYPILFSRGRVWYRVVVVASTMIACLLAEMVSIVFYLALGGQTGDVRNVLDHPANYFAVQALMVFLMAVFFYLLYCLFARAAHQCANPALRHFGMGLFAQLTLTLVMLAVAEWFLWGNVPVLITTCAFALVNIVADALILLSVSRANAAYEQQVRAAHLRAQLDKSLAHFKELADEIQSVARFRHDLRDELQAVAALVREGDYARADALAADLAHSLAGVLLPGAAPPCGTPAADPLPALPARPPLPTRPAQPRGEDLP